MPSRCCVNWITSPAGHRFHSHPDEGARRPTGNRYACKRTSRKFDACQLFDRLVLVDRKNASNQNRDRQKPNIRLDDLPRLPSGRFVEARLLAGDGTVEPADLGIRLEPVRHCLRCGVGHSVLSTDPAIRNSHAAGTIARPAFAIAAKPFGCAPAPSAQIQGVALQVFEVDVFQGAFVGCRQHDFRGDPGVEGFAPAGGAQAPAVAGLQTGKAEGSDRRRQVVAAALAKARNSAVTSVQTTWAPASIGPVSQQPVRKNPVSGRNEQSISFSPSTLR